jgi:Ca2+/Na+ antiporter
MFETLEEMREKSQRPMDPFWPLLMYSMDIVLALFYIVSGMQRHQRLGVLVGAVVFLLCLIWLITTIRSSVRASRRDVWVRGQIVICILFAYQVAYTVAR